MRYETHTVRIGERTGDVDWSFDFSQHLSGGSDYDARRLAMFRCIAEAHAAGREIEATDDGGWPRCWWGKVIDVGMHDGWPHWRPTPSFLLTSWAGAEWHPYYCLTDVRDPVTKERMP